MTTEETRAKRLALQDRIAALLRDFEKETGTCVESVRLLKTEFESGRSQVSLVRIDARL